LQPWIERNRDLTPLIGSVAKFAKRAHERP
jgi:hypothetical protein